MAMRPDDQIQSAVLGARDPRRVVTRAPPAACFSGRWLAWLTGLATLLLLLVVDPASSSAAALPGPRSFVTGLVDITSFQDSTHRVRRKWLSRAERLDSTAIRVDVDWAAIAPRRLPRHFRAANPRDKHYRWGWLDATVRSAASHGQSVLLTVSGAPAWAEAPHRPRQVTPGAWEPRPRDFAEFGRALALRYSGHFRDPLHRKKSLPRVSDFQAWNEPNLPQYLMPQWVESSGGSFYPASPGLYRALLNAFYSGVKAVQPHGFVLAAGTAPYGDPPGGNRMMPVTFLQGLFCLTPVLSPTRCPDPPHLDGLDHHPYAPSPTFQAQYPGDISVPELWKIRTVLHAAQRVGHVLPAGPKPLWITEIDWSTKLPQRVSYPMQARYLLEGFHELWAEGVSHVFWFQFRDLNGSASRVAGAGLYRYRGKAKPSAAAFRFPFLTVPSGRGWYTLWGRAPAHGTVVIEKRSAGRWQSILELPTTAGGIFYGHHRLKSDLEVRARIGKAASPAWSTSWSG
jgi:hypothetical protein